MIVFNLRCAKDHVFEAWFRDSATYDDQVAARKIACPACGSTKIVKAPMAPNIATSRESVATKAAMLPAEMMLKLRELRSEVEKNSDHVGDAFPEEARKIHYGETERRNIHGDATAEEARELNDEGVEFGVIPWVPRTDS